MLAMLHINDLSYRIEGKPIFEGATAGIPTRFEFHDRRDTGSGRALLFTWENRPEHGETEIAA